MCSVLGGSIYCSESMACVSTRRFNKYWDTQAQRPSLSVLILVEPASRGASVSFWQLLKGKHTISVFQRDHD